MVSQESLSLSVLVVLCLAMAVPGRADDRDGGFTPPMLAGRYALVLTSPPPHSQFVQHAFRGIGVLTLHDDGRIEGTRILYRWVTWGDCNKEPCCIGGRHWPDQEQVPQTFTGSYTVGSDGMGSGVLAVAPRPGLNPWLCSNDAHVFQPAEEERFNFVVSQDGCKLTLLLEGQAQLFTIGEPEPDFIVKTWMDGVAERQDEICGWSQSARIAPRLTPGDPVVRESRIGPETRP